MDAFTIHTWLIQIHAWHILHATHFQLIALIVFLVKEIVHHVEVPNETLGTMTEWRDDLSAFHGLFPKKIIVSAISPP